jgi:zinc and cadmium transporter
VADLAWILGFGLAMSAIALVGGLTAGLTHQALERLSLPAVAFAAGSLIGGAIFHLLPQAIAAQGNTIRVWIALAAGFAAFLALENLLHWHHCHAPEHDHGRRPLRSLILLADGLHNLIGGLTIGAVFVADLELGATAWLAAAMHEIPQEVGDFGILLFTGLGLRRALLYNLLSALTFPLGMLLAWALSGSMDVGLLVPFGAGNFLYIAAADLIPEVKRQSEPGRALLHFACLLLGLGLLLGLRLALGPGG